ncbi:hypothetical protein SOCE26_079470 [Sorangium cellulosum]|uniref:Uncharacterized protein n=1 Tax=Sorangium cellulosum TaxID=56 RepID=A0A2L0F4L9_SORCE|nr:hypothetical protein [Sorangium cellulosum]AUX46441.1 hypothetical protein SOCE26_079470 [Sorangium cellulosum]
MPPSSRLPFEGTSHHAARHHRGLVHVLGILSLLSAVGPLITGVLIALLGEVLGDRSLGSTARAAMALSGISLPVAVALALASLIVSRAPEQLWGPLRVAAGPAGLRLGRGDESRWIPRAGIRSGLVVPGPLSRVELQLRRGQLLELRVATEEEGARLLVALGLGAAERRVAVSLGSPSGELVAGCLSLPVFMFLGFIALLPFIAAHGARSFAGVTAAWLALSLVPTWLLRRAARPVQIVIGSDGVRVVRPFSTTWLPYAELTGVETYYEQLFLFGRREDRPVALRAGNGLAEALAQRIREAQRRAAGGEARRGVEALDRCGRDVAAWREDLRKLLGAGDYRAAGMTPEDALGTLGDAKAPQDRRIGAALLLRIAGHPEAQEHIRVAAEATVDDGLRAALELAAEEEIDEASLARALR